VRTLVRTALLDILCFAVRGLRTLRRVTRAKTVVLVVSCVGVRGMAYSRLAVQNGTCSFFVDYRLLVTSCDAIIRILKAAAQKCCLMCL
jgi:hypothetical protein